MKLKFTKMHGTGNDYLFFDCLSHELECPSEAARELCPRHTSVGADGIVMICSSALADAGMRIFNADGSEAEMCGNAIRCVGKYLYDNRICDKTELLIETKSGIKRLFMKESNGNIETVRVDMGRASTDPSDIGIRSGRKMLLYPIDIGGRTWNITCVSMGNPHAAVFCDDVETLDLEAIGPLFENSPLFQSRINTEFLRVLDKNTLLMRVYERGSGETYSCGTGACAAAVAAVLCGYCEYDSDIKVILRGGELTVRVLSDMTVSMSGDAHTVFRGVYETKSF